MQQARSRTFEGVVKIVYKVLDDVVVVESLHPSIIYVSDSMVLMRLDSWATPPTTQLSSSQWPLPHNTEISEWILNVFWIPNYYLGSFYTN
jgi:hypothetical protein